MSGPTMDDLRRILRDCAGDAEADLAADIGDTPFEELGYDSLALIETAARIKQEWGVTIPDELVAELRTPREVLDVVRDTAVGSA
ncbi:acyl carrier protein [Saccharopolyspora gloriosae]|uniref:acyl carrier protein n=1 Tax=Saccharopolyspora gloriosae TaxID=455344 RepID=UPI001FB6AF0F|nr:acyl carrier protein [Saccharopolyspora gloriosae]